MTCVIIESYYGLTEAEFEEWVRLFIVFYSCNASNLDRAQASLSWVPSKEELNNTLNLELSVTAKFSKPPGKQRNPNKHMTMISPPAQSLLLLTLQYISVPRARQLNRIL
jgi:hypothetical protein